jgi:hypothetical protein
MLIKLIQDISHPRARAKAVRTICIVPNVHITFLVQYCDTVRRTRPYSDTSGPSIAQPNSTPGHALWIIDAVCSEFRPSPEGPRSLSVRENGNDTKLHESLRYIGCSWTLLLVRMPYLGHENRGLISILNGCVTCQMCRHLVLSPICSLSHIPGKTPKIISRRPDFFPDTIGGL